MIIDFYFWGKQCPYNDSNKKVLEEFVDRYNVEVNYFHMDEKICKDLNFYSPTFTLLDKKYRWAGPIKMEILENYYKTGEISRRAYELDTPNIRVEGKLLPLNLDTYHYINHNCSMCKKDKNKGIWLEEIRVRNKLPHLGVLNIVEDRCVGGAEFLPSLEVPYDIPKGEDIAFLTCNYLSNGKYDYKSAPLEKLEDELKDIGYKSIVVIASEDVLFPNGRLNWFIEKGYEDKGFLYYEELNKAKQHLLIKYL